MKLAFHIQQLKLMVDYARAISFLEYRQSFSWYGNNSNSCHCLLSIYQIAVAQLNRGKKMQREEFSCSSYRRNFLKPQTVFVSRSP